MSNTLRSIVLVAVCIGASCAASTVVALTIATRTASAQPSMPPPPPAAPATPASLAKWEYKVIGFQPRRGMEASADELEAAANALGNDGWLCEIHQIGIQLMCHRSKLAAQ